MNDDNSIELEQDSQEVKSDIPFNPNDIAVNIVPRTIGQIVEMLEYNEIIRPQYQRSPDLWNAKKKSRFIESLMLNLPIPLFYFDEGEDKKWRVIDGLQRVSTLEQFILADKGVLSSIKTPFKLVDLEFRVEFNGCSWADLPKDVQRRILTNQITINLIGKGTPDPVKYNIFSRINQGSVVLNPQEIRTALFQGYRIEFIERLVSDDTVAGYNFLNATAYSISKERQQDLDFITRFLTFYLIDYKNYEPDMDSFLTVGMRAIPNDPLVLKTIENNFTSSMSLSTEVFGRHAFRKLTNTSDKRSPINKSLFEVISVCFAKCSKEQREKIIRDKDKFIECYLNLEGDLKFWLAISQGTASRERVQERHNAFKNLVETF